MPRVKKPPHPRKRHFIREWREHKKISQEKLAEGVGVDRTTQSKIERGILPYNQDYLEKVSFVLSVDESDLISVDPQKPPPPQLIWRRVETSSPATRERITEVVEALLKAG